MCEYDYFESYSPTLAGDLSTKRGEFGFRFIFTNPSCPPLNGIKANGRRLIRSVGGWLIGNKIALRADCANGEIKARCVPSLGSCYHEVRIQRA